MYVGNIGVYDRRIRGVQADSALNTLGGEPVDPQTVQYQMVRY